MRGHNSEFLAVIFRQFLSKSRLSSSLKLSQFKIRSIESKSSQNIFLKTNFSVFRRTSSYDFDDDYDDDYLDDYDGYVNYLRHEFCFDEFGGYGEDYEGPKGVLTSYLPDGTSVSVPKNGLENRNRGSAASMGEGSNFLNNKK